MIKKQSNILNIKLSKFLVAIGLLISINGIDAAEGGPCKDYGECDEFKYSLIIIFNERLGLYKNSYVAAVKII